VVNKDSETFSATSAIWAAMVNFNNFMIEPLNLKQHIHYILFVISGLILLDFYAINMAMPMLI
jgi:hypothetical protein